MAQRPQAWTKDDALALAGDDPLATLSDARDRVAATLAPVGTGEQRVQWEAALASRLDPIAAKIAPTMSPAQGEAWRAAMLQALSNIPAMVALTAAKRAMHQPMQFISEVESVIRTAADAIMIERKDAIARIRWLIDDYAACQRPQLPPATPEPAPTAEELAAMMSGVNDPALKAILRRTAIAAGWIPPPLDEAAA